VRLFCSIHEAKTFFFELKKKFPTRLDRCANGPVEALAFLISQNEKALNNYKLARYIVLHAKFDRIYSIFRNAQDGIPVISKRAGKTNPRIARKYPTTARKQK